MGLGKVDEVVEREGLGTCVGLSDFFFLSGHTHAAKM